jgi:hypothetical protein
LTVLWVPSFGDDVGGALVAAGASSTDVAVSGVVVSEDAPSVAVDGVDVTFCLSVVDVAVVDDVAEDSADDVALESVGSASTTGAVASDQPTPSATANAPTRPTYLT